MCEWCGECHAVTALCVKRPRWSRRGFLTLLGLGAVGLALPALPVPEWEAFPMEFTASFDAGTKLWLAATEVFTAPTRGGGFSQVFQMSFEDPKPR